MTIERHSSTYLLNCELQSFSLDYNLVSHTTHEWQSLQFQIYSEQWICESSHSKVLLEYCWEEVALKIIISYFARHEMIISLCPANLHTTIKVFPEDCWEKVALKIITSYFARCVMITSLFQVSLHTPY